MQRIIKQSILNRIESIKITNKASRTNSKKSASNLASWRYPNQGIKIPIIDKIKRKEYIKIYDIE